MAAMSVEELYEKYVRPLPTREKLRLVSLTAEELSREPAAESPKERSLMEFEGIAKHNPIGMDAQKYVRELRAEWDHRP